MGEQRSNQRGVELLNSRGVRLFARCQEPKTPSPATQTSKTGDDTNDLETAPPSSNTVAGSGAIAGAIGIVHGLGEHFGRYSHVAELLTKSGFLVFGYDQIGHGESPGRRGHVRSFSWLLDDVERMVDELRSRLAAALENRVSSEPTSLKSRPIFLYGHSLGGNLVINYLLRREVAVTGAIVSSPLLLPAVQPPAWKRAAAQVLHRVFPSARFPTGVRPTDLSHDSEAVAAYQSDPLVHDRVSARLAVQMLDAGRWALQHAAELTVPTLLLHGEADSITSCAASVEFARRANRHCTLKTYPSLRHELHWEREREEIIAGVIQWMQNV